MKSVAALLLSGFLLTNASAFAQIAVYVPPEPIYKAARVLFPQTNPELYWFCGVLTCKQTTLAVNSQLKDVSTCDVDIYGKKSTLENSEAIVETLKTLKPRNDNSDWNLTTYFSALSTYEAAPPHKVIWEESVLAKLYRDRIVGPCIDTPVDVRN